MSFADFDIEDLKSTKKAVWTLSCAILLVSALELKGSDISLLGLKVSVSQAKIVSILWLILILPFARYALALAHETYIAICRYIEIRYERRNAAEIEDIRQIEGRSEYQPSPEDIIEGYEWSHYENSGKRLRKLKVLSLVADWSQNLLNFILPRATIIMIALVALLHPNALKTYLDRWEAKPMVELKAEQPETEEPDQAPAE